MSQIVSLKDVLNCITQRCPKVNHSKKPQSGSLKYVPNCITQRCPKLDHFSLMYQNVKNWLLNGVPTTIFTFCKIDLVFSTIYLN